MQKCVFGHMQTMTAMIKLGSQSVQGLCFSLTESVGHYRICQWKAYARMRLCMLRMNLNLFVHVRRHNFAWHGLNIYKPGHSTHKIILCKKQVKSYITSVSV